MLLLLLLMSWLSRPHDSFVHPPHSSSLHDPLLQRRCEGLISKQYLDEMWHHAQNKIATIMQNAMV